MKQHSFLLCIAGVAVSALNVNADSEMTMKLNEGEKSTEYSISSISKITFEGNTMNIATSDGVKTADVLALENITFSMKTSATDNIVKDFEDGISISSRNGVIEVSAKSDVDIKIDIFSIGGNHIMQVNGKGNASADLTQLPAGIYIVKANNKTIKFIR